MKINPVFDFQGGKNTKSYQHRIVLNKILLTSIYCFLKSRTQNPEPGIRNPESGTRNPELIDPRI